ncbi:MAG: type II toxin-antitoxin system HicA family toxin [Clostridia bacterium]|nr:type II toxin-antitoxin system HicA family toxin [Clostridia bacterium]
MARLPVCSGRDAIKALERAGWTVDRQKGSHVSLVKEGVPAVLTVPLHSELDRGTLRALIRRAGLTVEEFVRLLEE